MEQMWTLVLVVYIIRTFIAQLMFCAVMNLINNSVDVYNMGAANGLGTAYSSNSVTQYGALNVSRGDLLLQDRVSSLC